MNTPKEANTPHSTPPNRISLMAKRILFVVVALATLIALFYAEENWRGYRAWQKHKDQMTAAGEKMDIIAFTPPPVPDDENFAMTPLLKPILDYEYRVGSPVQWRDTNGLERIHRVGLQPAGWPAPPKDQTWMKGERVDLRAWQAYYRTNSTIKTNPLPVAPQPQTPGADVILAFSSFDKEIAELKSASKRPYARFPVRYDTEDCFSILLPHLATTRHLGKLVALRALGFLETGQTDKAFDDVQLSFYLANSVKQEPFVVSQLVRFAGLQDTIQPIWEGMGAHRWSEEQLRSFQTEFAQLDFLSDYARTIKAERAGCAQEMEYVMRNRQLDFLAGLGSTGGPVSDDFVKLYLRYCPRGWIYQNAIFASTFVTDKVIPLIDPAQQRAFASRSRAAISEFKALPLQPGNLLMKQLGVAFTASKYAKPQGSINLLTTACALERYRIRHNRYPEKLEQLTPEFLPKVPHDIITGRPLNYKSTEGGQFVLYSVGWNEKDDNGAFAVETNTETGLRAMLTDPTEDGDWVWKFPATDHQK